MTMNASETTVRRNGGFRFPELWLTPIIGLFGLAFFVLKHDSGTIMLDLHGRAEPFILFGTLPLFATALVQRGIRALTWPFWKQVIMVGLIGCLVVGLCYFFAAPYFPTAEPTDGEGRGNIVALLQYEADILGLIGAFAAMLSTVLTRWLIRSQASAMM